jgi:predicted Zn-dependent protease
MPPEKIERFGQKIFPSILVSGLFLISFSFSGCAVNPVTGQTQFMTVSEEREFSIGQQVDKQVREEMGFYLEDPELRSLIKEVGRGIGQQTARAKTLNYRFEIVDSPDFNAFALPGGFVYVHRGLLEKVNSTDELASVLGHEIAHVDARHSAALISKVELLNIGLLAANVATQGMMQPFGDLVNVGAALALNKFSRDAEREADHLGTLYMTNAGFNPKASLDIMKAIQRIQLREPTTVETWFMTHPPTSERLVNLNHEIGVIQQTQPTALNSPIKRNQYIKTLDGLAVGEWNGQELIRGDYYYNKEFLLKVKLPAGWEGQINSKKYTAVFGQPKKDLYVILDIEPLRIRKTSEEYFGDFENKLGKSGLKKEGQTSRGFKQGALQGTYKGSSGSLGAIQGVGFAFVNDVNGYSLLGISKTADFQTFFPLVESMIQSLAFISQKEAVDLQPARLRIHEVKGGETWDSIMQKYFSTSQGKEKLAEYNGLVVNQNPTPGILLKIPPTLHFQ